MLSRRSASAARVRRRPYGRNTSETIATQSSTSAGSNWSDERPTSGGASRSTAVPTLHRMQMYPETGTRAKATTMSATAGATASLASPRPTSAPAAAAAATVAAGHARARGNSAADAILARSSARLQSIWPSTRHLRDANAAPRPKDILDPT